MATEMEPIEKPTHSEGENTPQLKSKSRYDYLGDFMKPQALHDGYLCERLEMGLDPMEARLYELAHMDKDLDDKY